MMPSLPPPHLTPPALRVIRVLHDAGEEALLAGGAVRDHLLGRAAKDFDIASSAVPERVAELFPKTVLVGAQFGVARVMEEGEEVEVVTFRTDLDYSDGRHPTAVCYSTPQQDAERRDFTINGLFYDLRRQCIIDYVGGVEDLQRRVIRAIGDPYQRFAEDRLRMLRAIRFSCALGFAIDPDTWKALLEHADAIQCVSAERIRDELVKMLRHPRRELAFHQLTDSGLMRVILPEVVAMRGVEQPPQFHPEGDVHVHTGMVLSALEEPDTALALAALLHDVGKPQTFENLDRIRFNRHEHVGAEMTDEICQRFRFSNKEREEIVYLVQKHMILPAVDEMRVAKRKRLFEEPHFPKLLRLGEADCKGSHGILDAVERARQLYLEYQAEGPPTEPLIRGRDLLRLGVAKGPGMGKILEEVEDARREGIVETVEQALQWVRDNYPEALPQPRAERGDRGSE